MRLLNRIEAFQPNQNHRRRVRPAERQMGMEVVIERHACSAILSGELKNFLVVSAIQTHVHHMDSVPSVRSEQRRCVWCHALIEQDPVHAT